MLQPEQEPMQVQKLDLVDLAGGGNEKIAYRILLDNGQTILAKIYRDRESIGDLGDEEGEEINKSERAKAEFAAYKYFKNTSLAEYTPEPLFLVENEQKEVIGLAVEYIDGDDVPYSQIGPSKEVVDKLQEDAIHYINSEGKITGILPSAHMFCDFNLMIQEQTGKLFFTQCKIAEEPPQQTVQLIQSTIADTLGQYLPK